jgi:lysozyme
VDWQALVSELTRDEGVRLKVYTDSVGIPTIGVGRNLRDVGISVEESRALLDADIQKVVDQLDSKLPAWKTLDEVRQRVLLNMGFNMGVDKLLQFHTTLGLAFTGRFSEAADAMLDSQWARQVGSRATRLAAMMRSGVV